ncbi:Haloacid dehalogenase-like hydrolase domain-containing protein 3 [Phytophthora pseudosyringae]|uniref:Haloacid dehalogenase-like hydrolase domain-containing protein 3 n=1 Tax=Phytophthora pseudosyringae TaxID=221518 RepID=A0A8T1VRK7_9STRA|nr:Haloacid dehalogenase-like hydrolase domain-containing protein 3 [Phytophthora pseudosyringae]
MHCVWMAASILYYEATLTVSFKNPAVSTGHLHVASQLFGTIDGVTISSRQVELVAVAVMTAYTALSVPAYQVLLQAAAETGYDVFVLGLLPVLKLLMRNLISRMDDMMPETVTFTVDFFNAFYIATSMQNASSTTTVIVIVAADLVNTASALKSLHVRTSSLMRQLGAEDAVPHLPDLLEKALSLCRHCDKFNSVERAQLQFRSCNPYRLSPENRDLLDRLDKPAGCHPPTKIRSFGRLGRSSTADKPTTRAEQSAISKPPRHSKELCEVLEILFTSECLVLSEYLEAFVSVLYANYVVAMVRLPSAKYHSELAGIMTLDHRIMLRKHLCNIVKVGGVVRSAASSEFGCPHR